MCRAVGENIPSNECCWLSQHSGGEHECVRVSQSARRFSPEKPGNVYVVALPTDMVDRESMMGASVLQRAIMAEKSS